MDWYTRFVSGALFPLHEWAKGHRTLAVLKRLEDSQWRSRDQIEEFRVARLRELLVHAAKTVPYYRQLFETLGVEVKSIKQVADLARLPLLDKATIRAHLGQLKSSRARGLSPCATGGSSGEPLRFFVGASRRAHDIAAKWRATRWWGVDIGDPEIVVWGSPIELGAQDGLRRVRDWLMRSELMPAFSLTERHMAECLARIAQKRPAMLFGYPSALAMLARHAVNRGWRLADAGVKVAFVTAERLYDNQREVISRAFGCAVANGYGARDAGFLAHECKSGGMHIMAEDVIVEIVDGAGRPLPAGRAGEIVVTHLASGDFPFIRYRTGDIGVLDEGECACGRGLPMLREIQGRSTDFVVAEDGTVMHGLALIYVLREMPGLAQFRIIQESRTLTRVEVVRGEGFSAETVRDIQQGLCARLGKGVVVEVATKPYLHADPSGKFRYVQSKVAA
ncbi:MAG: hypothetical protein RIR70_627 [Pseudomonadota bacterium]|jgi:phenylacetate-CoA ligase